MFQAIISTPGYLPMADAPARFETIKEAWQYLINDHERACLNSECPCPGTCSDPLSGALAQDLLGTVYLPTPGYDGDHDLGLAYTVAEVEHADYPHEPGTLYDCPACEPMD